MQGGCRTNYNVPILHTTGLSGYTTTDCSSPIFAFESSINRCFVDCYFTLVKYFVGCSFNSANYCFSSCPISSLNCITTNRIDNYSGHNPNYNHTTTVRLVALVKHPLVHSQSNLVPRPNMLVIALLGQAQAFS